MGKGLYFNALHKKRMTLVRFNTEIFMDSMDLENYHFVQSVKDWVPLKGVLVLMAVRRRYCRCSRLDGVSFGLQFTTNVPTASVVSVNNVGPWIVFFLSEFSHHFWYVE